MKKIYQKPCAFTIIYYFIPKNWLALKWIGEQSFTLKQIIQIFFSSTNI